MKLMVVDASVLVEVLIPQGGARQEAASNRLETGLAFFAPPHVDFEVLSVLRRLAPHSPPLAKDAQSLIADMLAMPIRREPLVGPVAQRVWELRSNMTVYDAGYVALAEHLNASLLTCDAKFTRTPGVNCAVELIA